MTGFSSLGIGSGLDLNALVSGLVRAERVPAEGRINRDKAAAQQRLGALGSLRRAVTDLVNALKPLATTVVGLKASASDAAVISASAGAEALVGTYQLQVSQLAAAQSFASLAFTLAAQDEPLGVGALTLSVGGNETIIELDEGNNTLAGVRDAINASGSGIQAVIVRDGEQQRLLLTSAATGTEGEMTLTVDGTLDTRLNSATMEQTVAASNAVFRINGLELTSSSNRVEDVIPGLALTLRGLTEGTATVELRVEPDRAAFRKQLEGLVNSYNALVNNMQAAGRVAPEGGASGPLVGDSTLRAIQSRLGGAFSGTIETSLQNNPFATLLELGLSTDVGGRAKLDTERLDAALAESKAGAEALVAMFAERLGTTLASFSDSAGVGAISSRTDSLDAQLLRLTQQRAALDLRMEQVEARLRRQFTGLDSLLAQFQSTSTFLTQQLAGLANLRPNNR
jgi:flagellar hook-associated protein 2